MAISAARKRIYYVCRNCGQQVVRLGTQGSPPAGKCNHSPKGPGKGPHSWSKDRTETV